jgi:hypothetical protein
MRRNLIPVVAGLAAVAGCSTFSEYQASRPIVQKEAKSKEGTDIFAVGAERRIVISQHEDTQRRFCSEPPPDVAQSFSDSVRAALQIAAQQQASSNQSSSRRVDVQPPANGASSPPTGSRSTSGSQESGGNESASGNANLTLARDFATSVSQIYTRSQGVQLFRDGSFMLCQAHLNGAIRGDKLEEAVRLATEYERSDMRRENPSAAPTRVVPSQANIERAFMAVTRPDFKNDFNYSSKFTELLNTVHSVLIQELPNLYRYDVEQAKKNAQEAAQRASTAVTQASASASAASAAQTSAGQLRDQAAQSAVKAAEASASAAAASVAAKRSADAAQAAASAAAGRKP